MKTACCTSIIFLLGGLAACTAPAPQDSSSFYYASSNPTPATPTPKSANTTANTPSSTRSVPRGGYAPGSGPTAMPQGGQFMYQQNVTTPFGSRSSTGVVRATGGVQSYQTIGGMPVYPGAVIPGYMPNQPYFGAPGGPQPVYVPGVNGTQGYYAYPPASGFPHP